MGGRPQSSASQHTEAEAEQHQSRVFLAVQRLQSDKQQSPSLASQIQIATLWRLAERVSVTLVRRELQYWIQPR